MKIFVLNIWNYNDYDKRKQPIIRAIKKFNPDIIALNEVGDFEEKNKKGENQAYQLNQALKYPYITYFPIEDMHDYMPEKFKHYTIMDGNAILSRYPIIKIVKKKLKKQRNDKHARGILHVKIKGKKNYDMILVHFSNDDVFSLLHLNETLEYIRKNKIKPIILGDLNILYPERVSKLTKGEYKSSYDFKKYLSCHDGWNKRDITLDYILIPERMRFKSFNCLRGYLSDHKALIAEIS